jgi:hypothetical protein
MTNLNSTFLRIAGVVFAIAAALAPQARTQDTTSTTESPIPVITGDFNFQSTFQPGQKMIMPEFDPVVLFPIGNKVLIESEYDMSTSLTDTSGQWGPAVVDHGMEYLQLNYIAHPNLTLTVGRFLTPFGIFRERLHPMWIRNVASDPLIFPMNDNSSNGAMARGTARIADGVNVTYATYFSTLTRNNQIQSDRRAGGRASLFFPDKRIEIGASYGRVLSDTHYGMIGADITWTPKRVPIDFRAEYEQTTRLGKGYWIEAAYHLNHLGHATFFRNSLLALRQEQYRAPLLSQSLITDLPDRTTVAPTLGYTYTMYNGVRFNASFGRNFATSETHNIWTVGLTYRFSIF